MACPAQRKRKAKFNDGELEVLVLEGNRHFELQQRNLSLSTRNAIWDSISAKVNAVGETRRTTDEIKRRWQDMRRRNKEKMASQQPGGGPEDDDPLTGSEEHVQLTVTGTPGSIRRRNKEKTASQTPGGGPEDAPLTGSEDSLPAKQESPEAVPSLQPSPPPTSRRPVSGPARAVSDDIDEQLLREQKKQSAALESIAREVREASSVARALRRDARAIATHTRQLVSAISGLTTAMVSLASLATAVTSLRASGPADEEPWAGEERTRVSTSAQLRKRRK